MSTGKPEPHPYWDGQEIVDKALAKNKTAAAAAAFHRATSLMPTAIAEAEADYTSVPEHIRTYHDLVGTHDADGLTPYPFTGRDAFALAAALRDHSSLEILDSFCGTFSEEPEACSADYLRIVQTIDDVVATSDVTDIDDIRKVLSPTDRVRLRSVWRAMRDAKKLVVESQGQKVFFHRDAPTPTPVSKPIPFRKGMSPAEIMLLERPGHLKHLNRDAETNYQSLDEWPVITPNGVSLPKAQRRTRKSETTSAGDKDWLQNVTANRRVDGSRYISTTVLNPDGSFAATSDLDWGRIRSNPQGDCGISIDGESIVRIYTPDAEQILAVSLTSTPEIRNTMRRFGDRELTTSSAIRSVHASLKSKLFVVSVINRVFVYSFGGDVITAIELDDEEKFESLDFVEVYTSRTDWAYFVQLAADGQGLYVGGYSGLLLHLSFQGELLDSWILPSCPYILWETEAGIAGVSGSRSGSLLFQAQRGEPELRYEGVDDVFPSQLVGSNVILETRATTRVFDLDAFVGRTVQLPRPRTAVYLANGRLTMETATARFIL